MDHESRQIKFLQFLWCSTICWFLLTGYEWTEIITLLKFSPIYLSELLLFTSSFVYLLTFSHKLIQVTLGLQIIEWFVLLPNTPNHRWVFLFGALIILSQKQYNKVATSFRYLLALAYFFAGFAKLNADFLFTSHSCSSAFLNHVTSIIPSFRYLESSIPITVTLLELSLSALLLIPRTRLLATAAALALHLGLALDLLKHFLDFSSVMSCLLITQLASDSNAIPTKESLKKHGKFLALVLLLLTIIRSRQITNLSDTNFSLILETCWLFYYFYLISIFIKIWRTKSYQLSSFKTNALTCFILILVILNGCCPYLGIKTRSAFSMYSNLWIDDSGSNHFLVNRSLDIFGFLKDDIEIVNTSDPFLAIIKQNKLSIPYYSLYSSLKLDPYIEVDFQKNGKVVSYPKEKLPSPGLLGELWITRKFLIYQASNSEVAKTCIW